MNNFPNRFSSGIRWYVRFYEKYAPDAVMDPNTPSHWREKVLYMFLHVTLTVGFIAWAAGVAGNIANQYWTILIAVTIGYFGCAVIFFFPRISYMYRAIFICTFLYAIGIAVIMDVGPFLASREWLFSFSIITSILLGWTGAIISIVTNLMTWLLIGLLIKIGFWNSFYIIDYSEALFFWNLIAIDLVFINVSTTVLITLFFIHINRSDQTAKTYAQLLLKEGRKLTESHQKLENEIEERKSITWALRESEERYRTILESIEDAYFEVDLKGNLTFFNRSLRDNMEYSKDELVGMNYRMVTNKEDADKLFETFNQVYLTRKTGRPLDIEVRSKNNRGIAVSVLTSLLSNNHGSPIGFRALARDVTAYKAMEDRLRRAQKMEAIGTLAGGVAHDLNNILSGVVNYPELLLLNMAPEDPMQRPIQAIKKSGEKAVAIVQDLLTLARRNVSIKDTTNLNLIITEYLQSNEFKTLQSFHPKVSIRADLARKLMNISGSPVHLSKALMNMVSNAAEAITDEGTVLIKTENRHIEMVPGYYDAIAEGDYVVLTICDTGDGIATQDLDKIFEPFFTKKALGRSGTGLGMAVVWGTIKDHGGHIDVQSQEGKGTTFTIYFPIVRTRMPEEQPEISINRIMGNGQNVLVVDDVEIQREIAINMLERLGYSVNAAKSGEEAINYLQRHSVDLLILDMIMWPGMDGLQTYKKIIIFRPDQKALIVSGFSETEKVKEAQRLGAGEYVRKPYSLQGLGLAVKNELQRSK